MLAIFTKREKYAQREIHRPRCRQGNRLARTCREPHRWVQHNGRQKKEKQIEHTKKHIVLTKTKNKTAAQNANKTQCAHKCACRPVCVYCMCVLNVHVYVRVHLPCSALASRVWDEEPPLGWHYSIPPLQCVTVCERLLHQQHFTPRREGQPIHTLSTHPCLLSITSPHLIHAPCMRLIIWPP